MINDRYDFINKVRDQIADEEKAGPMYCEMAEAANSLGMVSEGNILMEISSDEYKHHRLLTAMLSRLYSPMPQEEQPLSRPFPQTYEDWANLEADIVAKDYSCREDANSYLLKIYYNQPDIDDAKRWLVKKAGELGIS